MEMLHEYMTKGLDGKYLPARNERSVLIFLGTPPDEEVEKHEVLMGEDNNGINGDGLDEDGVEILPVITRGKEYSVVVKATNRLNGTRALRGWIDFNMNGIWEP